MYICLEITILRTWSKQEVDYTNRSRLIGSGEITDL